MLILLFTVSLFAFSGCRKHKPSPVGQLPPATQEGKNTLGFLLNGQPWTPHGNNGTANLSIDVDFGFKQGIFSLTAYNITSSTQRDYFGIGVKDSLNLIIAPKLYELGSNTLYGAYFSNMRCTFDYFETAVTRNGILTITKLDKTNRIIAGTFSATLSKNGCEPITITDGRFDMKY